MFSMLLVSQQQCKEMSMKKETNIQNLRDEVEEFFGFMDRDLDGRLSFEEFMGDELTVEKLFKNMDKNGDGLVTKQVRIITM
jgi:Ca2+-binding EF-hand superfamily protein